MCYHFYHICKFCNNQYICELDDYLCPTINHDADALMCDDCKIKEQEDFKKWIGSEEDKGQAVKLEDWDYTK